MAFEAPFIADNQPEALTDFGFYKVQRHTKSILVSMLKNAFDSLNTSYKIHVPEIFQIQNTNELTKIFVDRDFSAKERRIPIIIVAIKSATEKKMYIGADDFSCWDVVETSGGRKAASKIYHGATDLTMSIIVVAQSSEERMKLAEIVNLCFTHFYRWQYFYTYGDGNMYSIVPNTKQLEFGAESEVKDVSDTSLLYLVECVMQVFVEYSFRDVEILNVLEGSNIEVDAGPIEGAGIITS